MSILLLEKNAGLSNLMEGLMEDRANGIFVEAKARDFSELTTTEKYGILLIVMDWEDFGRKTLDEILNFYKGGKFPPKIWVLTEDTRKIHSEAPEANLILSKAEHLYPEAIRILAWRCHKKEEKKMSR